MIHRQEFDWQNDDADYSARIWSEFKDELMSLFDMFRVDSGETVHALFQAYLEAHADLDRSIKLLLQRMEGEVNSSHRPVNPEAIDAVIAAIKIYLGTQKAHPPTMHADAAFDHLQSRFVDLLVQYDVNDIPDLLQLLAQCRDAASAIFPMREDVLVAETLLDDLEQDFCADVCD
jgi:hypothetical protein